VAPEESGAEEAGVQHVELSLSDPGARESRTRSALGRWAGALRGAEEPGFVIDDGRVIVAMSESCCDALGLTSTPIGRDLEGVLRLLDFGPGGGPLSDGEVEKIPPLLALTSGRLARGLLRAQCADQACTFDAIATPVVEHDRVVGSLTFLSAV
jgi:hypothetical protein